eukprot:14433308-Ditylum_brightwellii.AAC.1
MADPFLAMGNIGVEPHVCRLTIVTELVYKNISEVRNFCYCLEVGILGLVESDASASSNWKLVQHSSPLGCCSS